jgi:hypothetical protein
MLTGRGKRSVGRQPAAMPLHRLAVAFALNAQDRVGPIGAVGAVSASCSICSAQANARRTMPSCCGSTSIVILLPMTTSLFEVVSAHPLVYPISDASTREDGYTRLMIDSRGGTFLLHLLTLPVQWLQWKLD